jgi:CheY-like chemotaxis protein
MDTKKVVLVIDDVQEIIDVMVTVLAREGIEAIVATTGQEGIAMAKEHKPDLILLDFKMPEMDGAETLFHLKEDPETKDIKVVFITAFGDIKKFDIDPKYIAMVEQTPCIQKGVDIDKLREDIKKHLAS